jgi:hypothetical protein
MEALPWFEALPPAQRADVGLVVQAGIAAFTNWLRDVTDEPSSPVPDVFGVAPRELTSSISLKQTVQLIRVVVGVLEEQVPVLAVPGEEQQLRESVLRYTREIAFAAADVYAAAAEARGAWDARLEASVVEALVRDQAGDLTMSRASALGWGRPTWTVALAAAAPEGDLAPRLNELRQHARHSGLFLLTGEAGAGLVILVGGKGKKDSAVKQIVSALPPGPVVVGPFVAELAVAASSVKEALAGFSAAPAWPEAPRPVRSDQLLAERALLGDPTALTKLRTEVYEPLASSTGELLPTVSAFLSTGGSLEGSARELYVHANTVRYRLRKVHEIVGLDLTDSRDAHVAWVSMVVGRTQAL